MSNQTNLWILWKLCHDWEVSLVAFQLSLCHPIIDEISFVSFFLRYLFWYNFLPLKLIPLNKFFFLVLNVCITHILVGYVQEN